MLDEFEYHISLERYLNFTNFRVMHIKNIRVVKLIKFLHSYLLN